MRRRGAEASHVPTQLEVRVEQEPGGASLRGEDTNRQRKLGDRRVARSKSTSRSQSGT